MLAWSCLLIYLPGLEYGVGLVLLQLARYGTLISKFACMLFKKSRLHLPWVPVVSIISSYKDVVGYHLTVWCKKKSHWTLMLKAID